VVGGIGPILKILSDLHYTQFKLWVTAHVPVTSRLTLKVRFK